MFREIKHLFSFSFFCFFVFLVWFGLVWFSCFLGPHSQHMKVPRARVSSELQLLAYTTATATLDP